MVVLVGCIVVDQQCRENNRKAKIDGYTTISMNKAHHPLSTEIVTVLSHHVIRKCWSMEGQAAGNKEEMVQQKAGDKMGSDQAAHQSGSGKEDEEDEEEKEGELDNRGMEEAG